MTPRVIYLDEREMPTAYHNIPPICPTRLRRPSIRAPCARRSWTSAIFPMELIKQERVRIVLSKFRRGAGCL
jgi:predicted alternative tryptophan synthase beta-subunit